MGRVDAADAGVKSIPTAGRLGGTPARFGGRHGSTTDAGGEDTANDASVDEAKTVRTSIEEIETMLLCTIDSAYESDVDRTARDAKQLTTRETSDG